ncbi:Trm112 family protein [Actinomycetota bacterium]
MKKNLLELLICPTCQKNELKLKSVEDTNNIEIREGEIQCNQCSEKFQIKDGILNLLLNPDKKILDEQKGWNRLKEAVKNTDKLMLSLPDAYGDYEKHWKGQAENFHHVFSGLNITGNEIILDLGAGRCWSTRFFSKKGCYSIAQDVLLPKYVGLLTSDIYINNENTYFERICSAMEEIPFKDSTFDFNDDLIHFTSNVNERLNFLEKLNTIDFGLMVKKEFIGLMTSGDTDTDGINDLEEFFQGTDPFNYLDNDPDNRSDIYIIGVNGMPYHKGDRVDYGNYTLGLLNNYSDFFEIPQKNKLLFPVEYNAKHIFYHSGGGILNIFADEIDKYYGVNTDLMGPITFNTYKSKFEEFSRNIDNNDLLIIYFHLDNNYLSAKKLSFTTDKISYGTLRNFIENYDNIFGKTLVFLSTCRAKMCNLSDFDNIITFYSSDESSDIINDVFSDYLYFFRDKDIFESIFNGYEDALKQSPQYNGSISGYNDEVILFTRYFYE